ncbi:proline and serine-rich protein 2 [Echinops telfairi]|uniref:Proline and serine-rich protein 2 n=1 Tax=Echinops telfairi TaxID=9371 RepID=A0AC55CNS0_ECHTE|nr:proline and serine-rich protein 2 [Echinops telfairi]
MIQDDESLKHLTHEEKDVLLFFEETIDSLEEDFGEEGLCDSGIHCHSPRSLEETTSSHSEPEDVIDLVQPVPAAGALGCPPDATRAAEAEPVGQEDAPVLEGRRQNAGNSALPDSTVPDTLPTPPSPPATPTPARPKKELLSPSPPAEHPKLPRSVPTPLVLAQKISEKLGGKDALSPTSPSREGRPGEWGPLTSPASPTGDRFRWCSRHLTQPAPKIHRFPSNISMTNSSGKEFNKTISKAAVNVQERKAQVLANINGVSFLTAGETGDRAHRGDSTEPRRSLSPERVTSDQSKPGPAKAAVCPGTGGQPGSQRSKGVQTEMSPVLANGFPSIHDLLKGDPSPFVSAGKTITIRPDKVLPNKLARQNATKSFYEHRQPDCGPEGRKRAGSLPRAVGFRPQGITVQFSGRGSTEEARREALRKLGLLKEDL